MDDLDIETRYLSEPGPLGLFTRLTRIGLLVDAFQHRCLDPLGLRFIDYSVLRVLQLAGPPYQMSPTELSDVVVRSTGGMTQILDRLERSGLVERTADASDRRKVVVGLTRPGLRTAKKANASYSRERQRLLSVLSAEEIEQIDAGVRRLLHVLADDAGGAKPSPEAASGAVAG